MSETMTAEQAASKLTNIMNDDHYAWHPSVLEAFRMAVDALRGAEGDCISRQTLKDALVETTLLEWEQLKKCYPMLKVVDEVPSAQPSFSCDHEKDHLVDVSKMDCISRAEAIEDAREAFKRNPTMAIRVMDLIKSMPSAQPKTQLSAEDATSDCISRQAAIAEFSCCELTPDGGIDANYAIDFLEQMPSAQPEQRWIPVTERLPNGFQTCIVTDELRQCSYEYDYNPDNEFTKKYGWRYNGRKIIAWKPLPEPWKEGEANV